MVRLSDLHLKNKLVAIQLTTACVVLLFYAAFTFLNDLRVFRNSVVGQLTSTADLIGGNSVSALDFMDPAAAGNVLSSLKAQPDIVNGFIYDKQGRVFAGYTREGRAEMAPPLPQGEHHEFAGGYVSVSRRIVRDGEVLGGILLRSDMKRSRRAMAQNALVAFAVLLMVIAAALLLAMLTQKAISEPILRLVAAAKSISETGDYKVRVEKQGSDEIGMLCATFNDMIAQIEKRGASLREAHRVLETRVRERTAELEEKTSKLRSANQQLGAIFQAADVGIGVVRGRVIAQCNSRLEEIFGYESGGLAGKPTRIWYIDEAGYALGGEPVNEQLVRGETHHREQRLKKKDGGIFWARLAVRALDPDDPARGMVGVVEDITAERERAQALKEAVEAARSADRLKSAFLATMSHELRTPLNSIIGFSGILRQELPGKLNDEQKKQLDMVRESSDHLLSLINDVLDISKIEAGQMRVAYEPFDMRATVHRAVLTAEPMARSKGLALEEEIAPEVGTVTGDHRRVEQVLLNLLSNAIKFTDKGRVRAECSVREGRISIRVVDNGIGIRKEDISELFKPFRQIDTGLTRQYEGTGLGLSICKKLVELMGGAIQVESERGKGSAFSINLPAGGKTT